MGFFVCVYEINRPFSFQLKATRKKVKRPTPETHSETHETEQKVTEDQHHLWAEDNKD